ncbi:DinB family protein [Aequorivita sp. SDUM287046]|uniref:DinB family protein n=1 Tax=Aequorivita aurantiaca TaxID=3053356 RepID=A0ABT8DI09_9FLAO|nr:DinB family protein [Aequorivita aurantiaca]MDN3724434.1 DinB family protein [Aequorivita aurantiaca]
MDTPKSQKLEIIIPAYRMHSQSFFNALDGITEEMALERNNGQTNHVVWMAGNFVNCRYWMANLLGMDEKDPNDEFFTEAKALDEKLDYPTLEMLFQNFKDISPKVYKKLLEATDEQLLKAFSFGMNVPFVEENVLNIIGMCIGREDYLLGQIGLMRKLLGLKGMSYEINNKIDY